MKNNKTVWIMILVFVLLIGGAYVLYNQLGSRMDMPQLATQSGQAQDEAGDNQAEAGESEDKAESALAPDFTVYDLNGNPVKLSDYRGKPVVLNFWSSRCGPCQMEMPDFQEAYEDLGEEIHFLMVNVTDGSWDTVDSASAFIAENNYTFPVFYDTDISAASAYGVSSLPTTYFIDAEGNGVAYGMGAMDMDTLMSGIEMILE
ncbi:MAG: TlpA family protein disulfide reductase [Eubacteriales bacterium]|jgi:peroxiredoxin